MKCYRCGGELEKGNTCPSCGASVEIYQKVIRIANRFYNIGLEQAKQRDLSGAIQSLEQALRYNKKQTDARNLLGLVYYEMGELGWAQYHWQVSSNFQEYDNIAVEYLRKVSASADMSDKRMAIDKYNQALRSANSGSLDIAILQVKKAVDLNPHMVKAQNLLALLYMQEEDKKDAKIYRALKEVKSVDIANAVAAKYQEELNPSNTVIRQAKKEEDFAKREKQEVIIPKYQEGSGLVQSFLRLAAGLVLGIIAAWFLIFPAIEQSIMADSNEKVSAYAAELSTREATITELNDEITTLTKAKEKAEKSLKAYTGKNGVLASYDSILICIQSYMQDDYLKAISAYSDIDEEIISDETFLDVYQKLQDRFEENGRDILYEQGTALYKQGNYEQAIPYYTECLELQADDAQSMYWLALCYHNNGDKTTADTYYDKLIKEYADTYYGQQAKIYRSYS